MYTDFKDMFNGGGMGQAGSQFEGGGLLSMLANSLGISPLGGTAPTASQRPQSRPMQAPVVSTVSPPVRPQQNPYAPIPAGGPLAQPTGTQQFAGYMQDQMIAPTPQRFDQTGQPQLDDFFKQQMVDAIMRRAGYAG